MFHPSSQTDLSSNQIRRYISKKHDDRVVTIKVYITSMNGHSYRNIRTFLGILAEKWRKLIQTFFYFTTVQTLEKWARSSPRCSVAVRFLLFGRAGRGRVWRHSSYSALTEDWQMFARVQENAEDVLWVGVATLQV